MARAKKKKQSHNAVSLKRQKLRGWSPFVVQVVYSWTRANGRRKQLSAQLEARTSGKRLAFVAVRITKMVVSGSNLWSRSRVWYCRYICISNRTLEYLFLKKFSYWQDIFAIGKITSPKSLCALVLIFYSQIFEVFEERTFCVIAQIEITFLLQCNLTYLWHQLLFILNDRLT